MVINFTNLDKLILFFSLISCYFFCVKSSYFGNKFKLLDIADKKIKIHKKVTPLIGGLVIFYFILIYFLFKYNLIEEKINLIIFLLFFFILGLCDDIFNITSHKRLFLVFLFLSIYFYLDDQIIIKNIYIETLDKKKIFSQEEYLLSFFFTILCISLLINAINMIDGINGNCIIISIFFIFIFNIQGTNDNFYYLLICVLLILFYFNMKNYLFLGNSGSYILAAIIAYEILENNAINYNISAEKIFLILFIPGVDMFRLFCTRIANGNHPFKGDRNHLHHYIQNKTNSKSIHSIFISITITVTPFLIYSFLAIGTLSSITLSFVFYFSILYLIKANKSFKF